MNLIWLKLIKRILTHKYYVAKYCFQIGLYWQGITHDLSKFSFTEFSGAKERYDFQYNKTALTCSKVRDLTTGKILEIKIDNPEVISDKPLLILDDLCDGGGTFCGIAKAFNALGVPKERLNIAVTHMVNPKGIENLSNNFNKVWFTNSYKDWDNLPKNVTMIKVV
jgi:hypothetical protein